MTNHHTFRNLKRRKVADPQLLKLAFLAQLVALLERLRKVGVTIRGMEVEDIDRLGPEFVKVGHTFLSDVLGVVASVLGTRVVLCG